MASAEMTTGVQVRFRSVGRRKSGRAKSGSESEGADDTPGMAERMGIVTRQQFWAKTQTQSGCAGGDG